MCTVTYLPSEDGIFLTSNRDEKHFRSNALSPHTYHGPSGTILYPRDPDGGGTWIAVRENRHAIVFLNGGFEAHTPEPPYRRSRGMILLDLISCEQPATAFLELPLDRIEPFTAVIWENGQLYTCVWDGKEKHRTAHDPAVPRIWSSSTLYNKEVREKRASWFDAWINTHPVFGLEQIMDFHRFTGDGDTHNDLLMNRNGEVFTVSITGVEIGSTACRMVYLDLRDEASHERALSFSTSQPRSIV